MIETDGMRKLVVSAKGGGLKVVLRPAQEHHDKLARMARHYSQHKWNIQ
jgi:hypothetical protein